MIVGPAPLTPEVKCSGYGVGGWVRGGCPPDFDTAPPPPQACTGQHETASTAMQDTHWGTGALGHEVSTALAGSGEEEHNDGSS